MKISGGKGSKNLDAYLERAAEKKRDEKQAASAPKPKQAAASSQRDVVEISQAGADLTRVKEVIQALPDVRTEKVEPVKSAVARGAYRVDGEKVAKKLIKENILDELL